jgi:hypothetical protein
MRVDFSGNAYLATDAAVVVDAFETSLEKLAVDRRNPEALVVAKHIISFANAGERDHNSNDKWCHFPSAPERNHLVPSQPGCHAFFTLRALAGRLQ